MSQSNGIPPGIPIPNYVNPVTRPPGGQITTIIFIILVTISLALRLYTRFRVSVSFGLDDVFVIISTVRLIDEISLSCFPLLIYPHI